MFQSSLFRISSAFAPVPWTGRSRTALHTVPNRQKPNPPPLDAARVFVRSRHEVLSDAHHVCQKLEGSGGRCRKPQRYADVRHGLVRGRRRRRRKTGDGQTHSTRRQRQRGLTSTKTRPEQEAEGVLQTIRRRQHSTGVRVRRLPGVWRMTTAYLFFEGDAQHYVVTHEVERS